MAVNDIIMAAGGSSAGAADDYFKNVTMLLTGDGTNGAQNNTFIDVYNSGRTIVRDGNTTQGSFSPYGSLWSNYFNGTTDDGFVTQSSSALSFGTDDFSIECWAYVVSGNFIVSGLTPLSSPGDYGSVIQWNNGTIKGWLKANNSSELIITSSVTAKANTWNHIALVRSSTTFSLYLNGARVATSNSGGITCLSTKYKVGGTYNNDAYGDLNGYVSNLRICKGTTPYSASDSTITVPTAPLTAVTGTQLLTCQSNRFVDNSANALTLSLGGTPSVQRFSPFSPTASYDTATIGGSGYFDGSGDKIYTAPSSDWAFGTGDFSIECWVYPFNVSTTQHLIGNTYSGQPQGTYTLQISGSKFKFLTSSNVLESNALVQANCWTHVVLTRVSGEWKFFINGSSDNSNSATSYNFTTSSWFQIGGTVADTNYFNGYITDVKAVKGTGYTSVSIPTAPVALTTNTKLLFNFTNAGIPDSAMMNDLETVGNAQVSTSVKKFGTGSIAFDGSGDCLLPATNANLYTLGGDFTIELWYYTNVNNTYKVLFDFRGASTEAGNDPALFMTNTGTLSFYVNGDFRITSSSLSTSTWYHVAIVRSGSTITMYLNGTSQGTYSYSTAIAPSGANRPIIGANGYYSQTESINGYIDDIRITKGYARYTANFTPPTAALPTK